MPYKDKKRETFTRRIRRILNNNPLVSNDCDKIIKDIEILDNRIYEIKKELEKDITYFDSGLRLIQKFKSILNKHNTSHQMD